MKVQITNGMLMALIINMLYAKSIGMTQGIMAREVKGDIWISTFFSTFQGLLIIALIVIVMRRIPEGDLIDQFHQILGKFPGKFVAISVFVFFIGAYGSIMATFVYHLRDYFLPEAPTVLFILAAFLIGIYAIHFGIEVVARMALIGVFSILALNILLMLGSLSNFDIKELLPVFQSGFTETVWASRHHNTDYAMTAMMVCMILPLVRDKQTWMKSSTAGMFYGGMIVVMWPILEAGVLTADVTAQYIVSCMQMARSAEIGLFIHRYEMVMVAFFALSILTQIIMTFLCSAIAVQKIFGLKDYRPVIIPVGIVLSITCYWLVKDHHRAMRFIEGPWVLLSIGTVVGLVVILWLSGFVFRKKWKTNYEMKQ
ncbi:GerAB/ArcD/ProY family transporter [Niallia alba]|uniref:GerAB/ArcD/ProY family transporter n=1 Tax=Niallia alba TaxID=2729105 RepID=UPI0039A387FD